jgi:lipopolysaccharide biosynthesis protein
MKTRKRTQKVLVLYCFHDYNDRVKNFIKDALFHDTKVDFLIISNNRDPIKVPDYVKLIQRDNKGYDFGAWSYGLLKDQLYKKYTHFIFVNSSVSGPYLPPTYKGKWTDIYLNGLTPKIKLFGSTINTLDDPINKSHVQSYIFSMTKSTLDFLIKEEIFSLKYVDTFNNAVCKKEVPMSRKIIKQGWNIGSLVKYYKGVDYTFKTKLPKDYPCIFVRDVMNELYKDKLWKKEDLVFVKGNRINCEKDCKLPIRTNNCWEKYI